MSQTALPIAVVGMLSLLMYSLFPGVPLYFSTPPLTKRLAPYLIPSPDRPGCATLASIGSWSDTPLIINGPCGEDWMYASCEAEWTRRWKWNSSLTKGCGGHYYGPAAARALLQGKRVACVGDSIARVICIALMRAVDPGGKEPSFERHADFEHSVPFEGLNSSVHFSFFWRPFPQNASNLIKLWDVDQSTDILLMSISLWHLLHVMDAPKFQRDVALLAQSARVLQQSLNIPVAVIASAPEVYHDKLRTPGKREAMTSVAVDAYNDALAASGILAPEGPCGHLDMFRLTYGCGKECSVDGIHSIEQVYDAASQILMNMLQRCEQGASCW